MIDRFSYGHAHRAKRVRRASLRGRYRAALRRYLKDSAHGQNRHRRLKLGTKRLRLGLDVLDLAMIHEEVLIAQAISTETARVRHRIIRRAGKFFAEAIIPMEETHRTALENNAR